MASAATTSCDLRAKFWCTNDIELQFRSSRHLIYRHRPRPPRTHHRLATDRASLSQSLGPTNLTQIHSRVARAAFLSLFAQKYFLSDSIDRVTQRRYSGFLWLTRHKKLPDAAVARDHIYTNSADIRFSEFAEGSVRFDSC